MKEYQFEYHIVLPQTAIINADSAEEAENILRGRQVNRNRDLLDVAIKKESELKCYAVKNSIKQGEWFNDEYQMNNVGKEKAGPFDSVTDALQAIKDTFGYQPEIKINFMERYTHMIPNPDKPGYWIEYVVEYIPC